MIYAFCFLGEFGYELFNWQGLVRKFSSTLKPDDKIVVCGRKGLDIWYEQADSFIDISEVPIFKNSIASMYNAHNDDSFPAEFDDELKAQLDEYITSALEARYGDAARDSRIIFSSDRNLANGIKFGPWPETTDIYGGAGFTQNDFRLVSPDLSDERKNVEKELGFSLSEPYILVQNRQRDIIVRSKAKIDEKVLLDRLKTVAPVVLLDFDTGRRLDSKAGYSEITGVMRYPCASAREQAVLVQNADICVFLTEGDFGSHIYVPPFMGKDVFAIAPGDIYEIGTTPLDFWNEKIFRHGGKIIPFKSEQLIDNPEALNEFIQFVAKRVALRTVLKHAEDMAKDAEFSEYYLWPRTPRTPNHQHKILERVGATDFDVTNPRSRSYSITRHIAKLIKEGKISSQFVLVDICGGDAVVGMEIKKAFPKADIIVQDCLKDEFETHAAARATGVGLYGGFIQEIIKQDLPLPVDFVMLLNTYRGWANADLHENEQDLPLLVDEWLKKNARFVFVTATEEQIMALKSKGQKLNIIGKGEDNSHMICMDNTME